MRFDGFEARAGSVMDVPSGTTLPTKFDEGNLFFLTGSTSALYVALATGWQKVITGSDIISTPLTGFSTSNVAITATDTVVSALGKIQGQFTSHATGTTTHAVATTTTNGFMSASDKVALGGHLNSTSGHPTATTLAPGFMAAADKTKLDSVITSVATPTASGYMAAADKTKLDSLVNTNATSSAAGYMAAADKTKLDSLISSTATSSAAGYMSAADKAKLDSTPTHSVLYMTTDVSNSNLTANSLATITELSFNVVAGTTYNFKYVIPYTAAATTTGSRWTINGPAVSFINYASRYTVSATSETVNYAGAYAVPSAANASSLTSGNLAIIEGVVKPSANGTLIVQFASEVSLSAITAKVGGMLSISSHT